MLTEKIKGMTALQGIHAIREGLQGIVGTSEYPSYDSLFMYSINVWPLGNTKGDDDPIVSVRRETNDIEGCILFKFSKEATKVGTVWGFSTTSRQVDTYAGILGLTILDDDLKTGRFIGDPETSAQQVIDSVKQLERAHERVFITRLADKLAVALVDFK